MTAASSNREQPASSRDDVFDSIVIGAGQAGLSSSFHLARLGLRHLVLDANKAPGGAWQHRWPTLTMGDVNHVSDLPNLELPKADEYQPARKVVPEYFAAYEREFDLPIVRPVRVTRVTSVGKLLEVSSQYRKWHTRTIVNATGTWTQPFIPHYPGVETFAGRQLHTVNYTRPEDFAGARVLVVGGGQSAIQILGEVALVASGTIWTTRRPVEWRTTPFDSREASAAVREVERRVRAGLRPESVVTVTGAILRPQEEAARELGAYERRPMFERIEADGVRWADGTFEPVDVIIWATGFRAAIAHLAPLNIRSPLGGIQLERTTAVADPRVQMVGYGPSASTIGANRAGRSAAIGVRDYLANQAEDNSSEPRD